ncbi:hypothetical protein GUJ93_ZPchr0012g21741 [Zizania palustris]|uniref:Uncharacterized protein n=1 Tax=Zizania palustris TaxID=103762 RepID=A0A8J6BWN1_ZIZPA|nr:hypothetical protein GUJ93_ZPchr0012g21741 [Zizania palustris]
MHLYYLCTYICSCAANMGTLAYPHVISQLHCVDGPPSGRGLLMDPVHRTRCVATVTSWYLCTMLVGCDDLEDMENLGFQCHSRAHIMSANSLGKRMTFCFLSRSLCLKTCIGWSTVGHVVPLLGWLYYSHGSTGGSMSCKTCMMRRMSTIL